MLVYAEDAVAYSVRGWIVPDSLPKGVKRFRKTNMDGLREELGAGGTAAPAQGATASSANVAAAERVREASRLFPASWVKKAGPLRVAATPKEADFLGEYIVKSRLARVGETFDNAIHGYVHHLQATLPGFQAIFRNEHLRRTTLPDGTRTPLAGMKLYGGLHRDGGYVDEYMGAHYEPSVIEGNEAGLVDAEGIEVAPRALQIVLHSFHGKEWLGKMEKKDPGMLDLVLGVLFQYDP